MKKFISEFKEFALKGNMLDLAIGLMLGTAFNSVVKSIVDDILMPIVGALIGQRDFSTFVFTFYGATIKYGVFIQNIVNFIIIAFSLFMVVKVMNKLKIKGIQDKSTFDLFKLVLDIAINASSKQK